jgi:uncharacterized protein YhbP (UPF0306 family)
MDLRARAKEVLDNTHIMSLATMDDGGVWVSDVLFIYDNDFNIYWMSDPDVRHSKALVKDPRVAGTITFSTQSKVPSFCLQFSGTAQKIDGPRYDLACKHLAKRSHPKPEEADDVLQGDSWYILTPNKIELIDEENFGFEKQKINL